MRQRRRGRGNGWVLVGLIAGLIALGAGPASAAPVTFTQSNYNYPDVSQTADGTLIDVRTAPAGVKYYATLDPAKTYRITVDGRQLTGGFVMRVDRGSQREYDAAPNGRTVLRVSGVSSLQILLYHDTPGQYVVRSVSAIDCDGVCLTDSALRAQILGAVDGLQEALDDRDDYAAATKIMHWVAPRIAWASGNPAPIDSERYSAAELLDDWFASGAGGVYCGGAADTLHKVLDLFSIPNFRVEFGTTVNQLTHAQVIVPIAQPDGRDEYRVLDPTWDSTFSIAPSGRTASVPVALELNRVRSVDRIKVAEGSLADRPVLDDPAGDGQVTVTRCGDLAVPIGGCSRSVYLDAIGPDLEANGFDRGTAGILELLGQGTLYRTDVLQVPQGFQDMIASFKAGGHVADLPLPPANATDPTLQGSGQIGEDLQVSAGTWSAVHEVTSYAYTWWRCSTSGCAQIENAGTSTYRLRDDDGGAAIHATVTAHNEDGDSAAARTAAVAVTPKPAPAVPDTTVGTIPAAPAPIVLKARAPSAPASLRLTRVGARLKITLRNTSGRAVRGALRVARIVARDGRRALHPLGSRRIGLGDRRAQTVRLDLGQRCGRGARIPIKVVLSIRVAGQPPRVISWEADASRRCGPVGNVRVAR